MTEPPSEFWLACGRFVRAYQQYKATPWFYFKSRRRLWRASARALRDIAGSFAENGEA